MIKEILIPEIAENIHSVTIVEVFVKEGDSVEKDQPLVEVETDKAVVEIPTTDAGAVSKLLVNEGDEVDVGTVFCKIETDVDASVSPPLEEKNEAEAPNVQASEKEKIIENTLPKNTEASPTPDTGKLAPASGIEVPAAPSIRKLSRELGVDIHLVKGTGVGGRISADDVKRHVKNIITSASNIAANATVAIPQIPLPDFTKWGKIERKAMSKVRKITAQNMSTAWQTIPHVTQFEKIDITNLESFRKKYGKQVEKNGGKLTITAILLKVIAEALRKFPQFNSSVDPANDEIIYKKYVNIGIAVDTDRGLLVPVIKDADKKSLIELSAELTDKAVRTRNKKTTLDELDGGNFTISNLGGIAGTYFTPIVYTPQVAILGISQSHHEPVYEDGAFVPRLMLPLSLSYDHRVIDGADAARFIKWIKETLEQPLTLLM